MAEALHKADICPALVEVLRADRESLNRRFALRQTAKARIDAVAFQEHLRTPVNALAAGVAREQPERVRAVVNALFDVSLELFAAGLLGPAPKHPHVSAAWQLVLPQATRLLARDPTRVAGALSNAVDHLAASPGARPSEWIAAMRKLAPHCDSVPQWLDAGKALAWRAGLVQYRLAALQRLRELPWKLAARCLDMPDDLTQPDWHKLLGRLEADRWLAPVAAKAEGITRSLRIVRTTGGFRGFGGPCLRPPKVTDHGGELFVLDGNETWQLLADSFGTLWQRVPMSLANSKGSGGGSKVALDSGGQVTWDGSAQAFAELAQASSFACDGQTLAVTLPTSYHVFLVARAAT